MQRGTGDPKVTPHAEHAAHAIALLGTANAQVVLENLPTSPASCAMVRPTAGPWANTSVRILFATSAPGTSEALPGNPERASDLVLLGGGGSVVCQDIEDTCRAS